MPVIDLSNNQLMAPNARASDVAAKAVENIVSLQQQKVDAAFRVQGIQCIVYHRLKQGKKCSCQAHGPKLNARLNTEGKADAGFINELLTNTQFGVVDYSPSKSADFPETTVLPLDMPTVSEIPTQWNQVDRGTMLHEEEVGIDGVVQKETLGDLYNGFDETAMTFGDNACPVCYGTGYVGGYVVYNGYRSVVPCDDMNLGSLGDLQIDHYPYSAEVEEIKFPLLLPRGIISIDACRLMNMWENVPCTLLVDGVKVTSRVLLSKCDGKIHEFSAKFNNRVTFTHFEFQANMSDKSSYIEFPKLSKNSSLAFVETIDDFQLLLSPNVPHIDKQDIICDCMWGKALYVQSTSWLNTRQRQMLGWEINVRVIQPQESFAHLPRRRVKTRNETVNPVIGNFGNRP